MDATTTDEREKLKEEIKGDLRREAFRRRMLGCGCSLFLTLFLTLAPVAWLAAQVAKTGFAEVQPFTRWYFRPAEPSREVAPLAGSTPQQLGGVIASRMTVDRVTNKANVRITEQELTTIVAASLASQSPESLPFRVSSAQLAVDRDAIELFMVVPREGRETTVKARFVPVVEAGEFRAEVEDVLVGSYEVPHFLARTAFTAFGSHALQAVQDAFGATGTLTAVELEEKALTFVITLNR